jgi:hypothetical protein
MQDTRKGRSKGALFVRLPHPLREKIVALARENRRTLTAEVTLAVECYLEKAVRGSLRWHELAGEEPK